MEPVISFQSVSKRYHKYETLSLREVLSSLPRKLFKRKRNVQEDQWFWAVKEQSFSLMPGEIWGIIGPNGAGKSTTLKLLSKITRPTTGKIITRGRISSLIELGAGFHPELSGDENLSLNGAILGMSPKEILEKYPKIVEFSGLEAFMGTPVKYFSSGMYARLGFAIAAFTEPDILLVDEVLAVGDYAFQRKCYSFIEELRSRGTTVILVSHNMEVVSKLCQKVILMDHGQQVFVGDAKQAIAEYSNLIRHEPLETPNVYPGLDGISLRVLSHEAKIDKIYLQNKSGMLIKVTNPGDWVTAVANVQFKVNSQQPIFSIIIRDENGMVVYNQSTLWQKMHTPEFLKDVKYRVEIDLHINLVKGIYSIGMDIVYHDLRYFYDRLDSEFSFVVSEGDNAEGIANLESKFRFSDYK